MQRHPLMPRWVCPVGTPRATDLLPIAARFLTQDRTRNTVGVICETPSRRRGTFPLTPVSLKVNYFTGDDRLTVRSL